MNIPKFTTLYKLNNNKIYEWNIEIEEKESNVYTIITRHGEKNGKMILHRKDISEGKVKRSVLNQAILEANRRWLNKKKKELYKEVINKEIEKSEIVRPMLAHTFSFDRYNDEKKKGYKISFPAFIQRKYDGIRCIAYIKDNEVILESRKGILFQNLDLLKSEIKTILIQTSSDFYLDGELYTQKFNFETISGLIRLQKNTVTTKDIEKLNDIEYHIYDFIDLNQKELPFCKRNEYLINLLNNNPINRCKPVETILIEKIEDVKNFHQKFIEEGYEGVMIRESNGKYEINKRSRFLQKYKEFLEDEFEIVGYTQGTGDEFGCVIWECITDENKKFNVRPVGTFESRKVLFQNATQYIGQKLTVKFQEYTLDKTPRFGIGKAIRHIY